ncbi:MAG: hypothetical protein JNK89_00405 [Saprospiraceae bacterium]|nr:hypothetical protein [Saprospiraceae bacterium]
MLNRLREVFFKRLLKNTLAEQNRQRKTHTLHSAKSVGILFDATNEQHRKEVLQLSERLKAERRQQVRLLGYVDSRQPLGQTLFPQFTQKEINWQGKPHGNAADTFLQETHDVVLCLNSDHLPALHWLAVAAKAGTKIGTATTAPNDFDIMLEAPAEKGLLFFMDQLEHYLEKIIPTKHGSASTP